MGTKGPHAQHDELYIRMAAQLKQMRLDAGLTQVAVSDAFNRPKSFAHKIEAGSRRIDPVEFCRWCHICKVDPTKALGPVAKASKRVRVPKR